MQSTGNAPARRAAVIEALEGRLVLSTMVTPLGDLVDMGPASDALRGPGTPAAAASGVSGWTLLDGHTGDPLGALSTGSTVNLRGLATRRLDIRAETVGDVAEVDFSFDGQRSFSAETKAPFTLYGSMRWQPTAGRHVVVATPVFSDGTRGTSTALAFSIVDAPVSTPPTITVSTSAIDFGEVAVGANQSQSVTLSNTGSVGLFDVTAIHFDGAGGVNFSSDFASPVSLAAGESKTVQVTFTPSADGAVSATMTIETSASNGAQQIALVGLGTIHVEPGGVYTAPSPIREVTSLDPQWQFQKGDFTHPERDGFDDSQWDTVTLPHTWNALDGQDGGDNYYRGTGWYRKEIDLPASDAGKELFIKFDGAFLKTDLYINGVHVGSHDGGFAAFTFDVTTYLKPGERNLLAVKVDNSPDSNIAPLSGDNVLLGGADFTFFGGLYRDVTLVATPTSHVTLTDLASSGVFLQQKKVTDTSAAVDAVVELRNDGDHTSVLTVRTDIVDAAGNLVQRLNGTQSVSAHKSATYTQSFTMDNPHLWDGVADPYIYQAYITVMEGGAPVDVVQQPLGLRYFSVDPKNGFYLDGKYLDLHGVDYHQDRINEGWAITPADRVEDVGLMQEMGVNMVRMSHYQQDEQAYDLFDKAGFAVWSEIPYIYDSSSSAAFASNIKQQLQEMIRQNYNHPSVMFWGLFNGLELDDVNRSLVPALNKLAHTEDPSRLTTADTVTRAGRDSAINFYTDLIGYNDYYGWYRGSFDDFGSYADDFHKAHPNTPFGVSEFGAGGSIKQHEENPHNITASGGKFHPEDYQSLFHEAQWEQMKSRRYLWCKDVFSMFDFAVDKRDEGDTPGRNDKGLVTYDRKTKKDAFYFYKSNWTNTPTVYITDRRFTDRPDKNADIKIYSNLDSVELFVNGKSMGTKTGNDIKVFQWNGTQLQSGVNTIQAVGTKDGQQTVDTVTWNA